MIIDTVEEKVQISSYFWVVNWEETKGMNDFFALHIPKYFEISPKRWAENATAIFL